MEGWFKIKVSDILLKPGSIDKIDFSNKKTQGLKDQIKKWIDAKVEITWLDEKSLLVNLYNLKTQLLQTCEITWEEFLQDIEVEKYEMKFFLPADDLDEANIDDDIGFIDEKDMSINIEDMVEQSIILSLPTITKSPNAEEKKPKQLDKLEEIENKINWIYEEK